MEKKLVPFCSYIFGLSKSKSDYLINSSFYSGKVIESAHHIRSYLDQMLSVMHDNDDEEKKH